MEDDLNAYVLAIPVSKILMFEFKIYKTHFYIGIAMKTCQSNPEYI